MEAEQKTDDKANETKEDGENEVENGMDKKANETNRGATGEGK